MAITALRQTRLSHVRLRTQHIGSMISFYERVVGLVPQGAPGEGRARLGWGAGDHVLELVEGEPGLLGFAFEVCDADGLDRLVESCDRRDKVVSESDRGGRSVVVRDPDGTEITFHGPISRVGEHTADPGRRPTRLQHVTLFTQNMEQMVGFYTGLGFQISDRMGDVFTWLRSSVEHHSLAIVHGAGHGLDHYNYDVNEWNDFKVWCDRLSDLDVPVTWGPGRHGPGNNLFIFFDDPDGNRVELSAEMERFWDDRATYETRIWKSVPETVNLWGGQLAPWRTAG